METIMENFRKKVMIIVVTHKEYPVVNEDCYMPLQLGKALTSEELFTGDDTGENISEKNPYYCELTGLYWMWKNVTDKDYVGIVHYRRYLGVPGGVFKRRGKEILKEEKILSLLKHYDMILPVKRHYIIESVYKHYAHTHYVEHLNILRDIIVKKYPAYLDCFDIVMQKRSMHAFNMFIMSAKLCDRYCSWLFDILEEMDHYVDYSQYDPFQARIPGRIAEFLLNVWILYNDCSYVDVPVVYTEKKHTIAKTLAFMKSYVFRTKYKKSI